MSDCKIVARYGNKSVEAGVYRPDFAEVLEAYKNITNVGIDEWVAGYKSLMKRRNNFNITEYELKKEHKKLHTARSRKIYEKVSNKLVNFFDSNPNEYINTCATRISYAINHSSVPFHKNPHSNKLPNDGLWLVQEYAYYISVYKIIESLQEIWGKTKVYSSNFEQSLQKEHSMDFFIYMTTKDENKRLFSKLKSLNKQGVVAMIMQNNSSRHSTLWDRDNFADVKMNNSLDINAYLYGYDFLNDPNNEYKAVTQFYFWELK